MEKVNALVVDKTGTLTVGKPALQSVHALPPWSEGQVLAFAASLELGSEHPLAGAIVAGARERGIEIAAAENFRSVTGKGVVE